MRFHNLGARYLTLFALYFSGVKWKSDDVYIKEHFRVKWGRCLKHFTCTQCLCFDSHYQSMCKVVVVKIAGIGAGCLKLHTVGLWHTQVPSHYQCCSTPNRKRLLGLTYCRMLWRMLNGGENALAKAALMRGTVSSPLPGQAARVGVEL